MSIDGLESFDPNDKDTSETKIKDGTAPCNVHGLIKYILEKLEDLEARIIELEK